MSKTIIKKLDDTVRFDEIETNIKLSNKLKKHEKERYSVFYNAFNEMDIDKYQLPKNKTQMAWIGKYYKDIYDWIIETYDNDKFKTSTLRTQLEGLANILLALDKNKFKETVRPMFKRGIEIQKTLDDKIEDSTLSDTELLNFVCYSKIVTEIDDLYFKWIDDAGNNKLNMYHLILAFNTYIPPLRLELVNMEFHLDKSEPDQNETNYLWEYEKDKYAIVINNDKIEHLRKLKNKERQIMKIEDEIKGVTNGELLNVIISDSLKFYPRKYVLGAIRKPDEPLGRSSYNHALKMIFKPKKPTQNLLRKAYINHWYDTKNRVSEKNLKKIASRMRHTTQVARSTYSKINIECDDEIKEPVVIPTPEPKKYFNPKEYSKKYRTNNKESIKKYFGDLYKKDPDTINRTKIVRLLNLGLQKRPRQKSIDRYNLKYNKDLKQWE